MKKKNNFTTALLVLALLTGLSLLLYPTLSDRWNSFHQSRAIAVYAEESAHLDETQSERLLADARRYNEDLAAEQSGAALSEEQKQAYEQLLDITGLGVMGCIEIPEIGVSLPIYHGTDDTVLQIAVGHLEWSSLPVGGRGTHCVLSGHRGLPGAKLLTHLDRLTEGDLFMLRVLDEVLTYEVDQVLIVEPDRTDALYIEPGQDYCTLVTCTPYGVNSHRILVRGRRIENPEESKTVRITADAARIEPLLVAPIAAAPILLALLAGLLLPHGKKRPPGGGTDEAQDP